MIMMMMMMILISITGIRFFWSKLSVVHTYDANANASSLKYVVEMTIANQGFDPDYNDLNSPKRRVLILQLEFSLRNVFIIEAVRIIRFFEGSLGIEYELQFDSSSDATNASIRNELIKANGTNELGFLQLGRISVVEIEPTTPPTSATTTIQDASSGKHHFRSN